jgi:hypothetical protein
MKPLAMRISIELINSMLAVADNRVVPFF